MKLLLALLLLIAPPAHATPLEILRLEEMLPSIQPGSLVVFDLDNTVMQPKQMLGTDQWFSHTLKRYREELKEPHLVEQRIGPENGNIFKATDVQLVEPETAEFIRKLQQDGYSVVALTARNSAYQEATARQLESLGVDFTSTAPSKDSHLWVDGKVKAQAGVIYTSGTGKAEALEHYLEAAGMDPSHVILVDDRFENVDKFEKAMAAKGRPATVFRYGGTDHYVKVFDHKITDIQHEIFRNEGRLLSDEEARALLTAREMPSHGSCEKLYSHLR